MRAKSGQRKYHIIQGRYRTRQRAWRKRSMSTKRSPAMNQGYDQPYNEDFKAGFAQGYEDGHFAASSLR